MSVLKTNKSVVVDYYQTAFAGDPERQSPTTSEIGTSNTTRMLPMAPRPSSVYVTWLRSEHPQWSLEIKRVIAEGDTVANSFPSHP